MLIQHRQPVHNKKLIIQLILSTALFLAFAFGLRLLGDQATGTRAAERAKNTFVPTAHATSEILRDVDVPR